MAIGAQNAGVLPRSLWSAPGIATHVLGPAHASYSARDRAGGMIPSAAPTMVSIGTPTDAASAALSNRCRSSQSTGSQG